MFFLPTLYIMKEYNNKGHTSEASAVIAVVTGSSVNVEPFLSTPVVGSTFSRLVLYWKSFLKNIRTYLETWGNWRMDKGIAFAH